MAKRIYVGVEEEITFISTENIFPSSWTDVSPTDAPGTSYIASDGSGIKLTASGYKWRTPDIVFNDTIEDLYWCGADGADEDWICIEFPEARLIAEMKTYIDLGSATSNYVYIQGSNDGATWTKLKSFNTTQTGLTSVTLNNTNYYKYYRWYMNSSTKNLSIYQIQGFERITTNKGVAHKVKKAYVGADGNLVVNGDFSDGLNGWTISNADGGNVTLANKDGYTCIDLYRNSTTITGTAYFETQRELNVDVSDHKVYICGYFCGEASNTEGSVVVELMYSKDYTNYSGGITISGGTILEEWTFAGRLYDFSNSNVTITSVGCAIYQTATNSHVYFRDIQLYDLTALYGAGNEPTQEWCDANVEALAKKSVAHKIKKGYISVGGVARLFYSTEKVLSYYGTATNLASARYSLAATSVGDYALFGGGQSYSTVDTYTSALVKGTGTNLAKGRSELAATSVGDYALFAGGYYSSTWYNNVDTYTSTLTKGTATTLGQTRGRLAATTVGDYALFGGGYKSGGASTSVDSYTSALVKGSTTLSVARQYLAATTVGNFALFGGGTSDDDHEATVDGFNASKVRITVTALSIQRQQLAATTVGNYALFGGGKTSSTRANVDTYTSSLVKGTAADLSSARAQLAATTVGDYAIFAGGVSSAIVDTYTSSLVKGTAADLSSARGQLAATTIGDYALFGGGNRSASSQKTVDVYQVVES